MRAAPPTRAGAHVDSVLKRAPRFAGDWTYRLGASPLQPGSEGGFLWAQPGFEDGRWLLPQHPGKPPVARNQPELWARVRLVGPVLRSPTLSLRLFGHAPEVYLQGERQTLEELPHHPAEERHHSERRFLLHLGSDYQGKTLTIHMHASSQRIGVLDPAYLGEPAQVMAALIHDGAGALLQAVIVLFVGISAGVLFLVMRTDAALIFFALLCLGCFCFLAGASGILNLLTQSNIPGTILFTLAGPLGAVGACSFVEHVLPGGSGRILRWPRWGTLLILLCELAALAYDVGLLVFVTRPALVMVGIDVVMVVGTAFMSARHGEIEGKIICGGLAVGGVMLLPDILTLSGVWSRPTQFVLTQFAIGSFLLALALMLVRRFMEVYQKLGRYSLMLGEQVRTLERRNTDIQNLNDELRRQIEQRSDRMIEILSRSRSDIIPVPKQSLAAGELLNEHYRVVRALGEGAMGAVYEVERTSDGLHLAAKLMSVRADRKSMIRFVREARILAQLKHQNLVAIMDIDISLSGVLFLAMELIEGTTLRGARPRFAEPGFAWTVLRQMCAGLQAIHERGITHRDLKPSNVLLAETAQGLVVKIADFGISTLASDGSAADEQSQVGAQSQPSGVVTVAPHNLEPEIDRNSAGPVPAIGDADTTVDAPSEAVRQAAAEERSASALDSQAAIDKALAEVMREEFPRAEQLTRTGVLLGTPLYMAPELAKGSRKAQPSSDLFSLGLIAFELLTGALPFKVPAVVAIWEGKPLKIQRLSELRPDLPVQLTTLLDRCLDIDPANRPTLAELIAAIP